MGEMKRILIVEDELGFAKMVKLRLESVGYAVTIAGDAYTGTQEIVKNAFDLIILDLMMPAGGGFSLLERIRRIPSKATIPVLIVTGKTVDDEVKRLASEYDVSEIFTKPYNSAVFVDKINSLLGNA
jgi:DNA-binding response OmpR family regulator